MINHEIMDEGTQHHANVPDLVELQIGVLFREFPDVAVGPDQIKTAPE
jgi:hypothetical protein